jgi:hypothetical protein
LEGDRPASARSRYSGSGGPSSASSGNVSSNLTKRGSAWTRMKSNQVFAQPSISRSRSTFGWTCRCRAPTR